MRAVVKSTGEVLEFNPKTSTEIHQLWQLCSDYIKAYEAIKEKLKPLVADLIGENGVSEPHDGYIFRQSVVQRVNYDKSVMRELLDPDTYDVLTEPAKTKIDDYLQENLEKLGEISTMLRNSMTPVGKPYRVIKREKIS